jgi:hypothetical protein
MEVSNQHKKEEQRRRQIAPNWVCLPPARVASASMPTSSILLSALAYTLVERLRTLTLGVCQQNCPLF